MTTSHWGIALIVAGIAIALWMSRRVFLRTNSTGVQEFSSFTHMVVVRLGELVFRFLALGLILVGLA